MPEAITQNIHVLKILETARENLNLLSKKSLLTLSGSIEKPTRIKARGELERRWLLEPERSAENAPGVDLMAQVEEYTEDERALLLTHGVGLQLTKGCNGECSFCLHGIKKGVEAKYSKESLIRFFEKYGEKIKGICLHWNSDSFDWKDEDWDFADLHRFAKKYGGEFSASTAVPRGSEDAVQKFMNDLFVDYEDYTDGKILLYRNIRFSVGRHNIQRVESVIDNFVQNLKEKGIEDEYVNAFFNKTVRIEYRGIEGQKLAKLGVLIKTKDPFQEIEGLGCDDGIVFTPEGIKASLMVAPSILDPSGQRDIYLKPGEAADYIPTTRHTSDYDWLDGLIDKQVEPNALKWNGNPYKLPEGPYENAVFWLSRRSFVLAKVLDKISNIYTSRMPDIDKLSDKNHFDIAHELTNVMTAKRLMITGKGGLSGNLAEFSNLIEAYQNLPNEQKNYLSYYLTLYELQLRRMELVTNTFAKTHDKKQTSELATRLKTIGKEEIPELVDTLKKIEEEFCSSAR